MNQITPYPLWIGHAGDGGAFLELLEQGIKAVVQLAMEEPPSQPPRELICCRYPLFDGVGNPPETIQLAVNTVAVLIKNRVPTLVSCGAGLSRSPVIVAAALGIVTQSSLEDSLKIVAAGHPVDISPGFLAEVEGVIRSGFFG